MKIVYRFIFFIMLFLAAANLSVPSTAEAVKSLRVGIFPFEPINYMDESGQAQGFYPDLLREIAREAHWELEFVPGSWNEGLERLQSGAIDLIMSVAYSQNRAEIMDFTHESVMELWGQVYIRPEGIINNISDLAGRRVGVMRKDINGTNFRATAREFNVQCDIFEFPTHDDVFTAVKEGVVDAGVAPQHFGLRHTKNYDLVPSTIQFSPFSTYFAVKKGQNFDVLTIVDRQLTLWKQDKESVYYQHSSNWLGIQPHSHSFSMIPRWLPWVLATIAVVVMLLVIMNMILKSQIKKRTRELLASERYNRMLFDQSLIGLAVARMDGKLVDVNSAYVSIIGRSIDETLNLTYWDITPDKYVLQEQQVLATLSTSGVYGPYEKEYIHKDGHLVSVRQQGLLIELKGEKLILSSVEDITERKLAEEALRRALNFTEVLLEQSPMGIRVFDGDTGICLKINQAAVSIAGGPAEILLKQNFRELKSLQDSGMTNVAETVLADGVARQVETDIVTTFGKTLSVRFFFARFFAEKQPHLLMIGQDISEEKLLVEEKQQMEKKMLHAQKLESLGILAGGIAHDFNNILMAVTGHAELALLRLSSESPVVHNLKQIQIATKKAADIAGQMLAYSGKGRFVIENLDLNRVIEEMTHVLEGAISKKAQMLFNFTPNLPAVETDATQLRQVITNLIINASEALGEKSGVITISTGVVNCDRDCLHESWVDDDLSAGLYVYFEVTDTGCGMNMETLNRIYDPFFSTKFTGRGLGMAAAQGIVRGHKGMIQINSEIGQGTTFRVLLPKATGSADLCDDAETDSVWQGSGQVLLVDDEAMVLAVGKAMLEELGFEVLTASNGLEAVALFKEYSGTIGQVVMDLTMPHMGGEEAFGEMRQLDPKVKVIITSGYNEQEITPLFAGKGLSGFIHKPFSFPALREALATVPVSNLS
ncbi:MAG: transporter substrate-binding domain-containing protein [Desulfuromonadales bacterium]|nr:transporter substrate-binding domain-containing protein [Desulfuromonadales bacterium]